MTNQTLNTARTVLQNDGFSVAVLNVTNNKPAGIVIGQDPAGQRQGKGGLDRHPDGVTGPREHDRPVGSGTQSEGRAECAHQGAPQVQRPARAVRDGRQGQGDPHRPGQRAVGRRVGSTVTLYISSGKPLVTVPNVIGESWLGSQNAADQRRLRRLHDQPDDDQHARRAGGQSEPRGQHQGGRRIDRQPGDRPGADHRPGARCHRRHRQGRDQRAQGARASRSPSRPSP